MIEKSPEQIERARANLTRAWKDTQTFAKEHELEHFLDKPTELNSLILKLIKLESDMQFAQQRHIYDGNPNAEDLAYESVSKYAQGKFTFYFSGKKEFADLAKRALSNSVDIHALLNYGEFFGLMRQYKVPEDEIMPYLEYFHFIDDCYASERTRD
jgi:hypothetical protein